MLNLKINSSANGMIKSSFSFLTALSMSISSVRAAEATKDVQQNLIEQGNAATLNLDKEALQQFPELANLLQTVCSQQKNESGLSEGDAKLCLGLIRIIAATEIKKSDLTEKEKSDFIEMNDKQFNRYCLSNNIYISYNFIKSEDNQRYYFNDIIVAKVSKSEELTELASEIKASQAEKFKGYGLQYPDFEKPVVYKIEKKIIDQSSLLAATIVELPENRHNILIDLNRIKSLSDEYLTKEYSNLVRGTLSNEISHIRYAKLYPDRDQLKPIKLSLENEQIKAIEQERNEAFSDFASLTEYPDNFRIIAYDLSSALTERGGTYRLSDRIQFITARQIFGPETFKKLTNAADEYKRSTDGRDYQKLIDLCFNAISKNNKYCSKLKENYLKIFNQ